MKREFNDVEINVEFQETQNRQQINSGESANTLFGKIKKWLSDLKPVAFSGKFSDLTGVPTYTPYQSGIYKITVDSAGNISLATPVTKQDLLDLGIVTEYKFEVGNDGNLYYSPKQLGDK